MRASSRIGSRGCAHLLADPDVRARDPEAARSVLIEQFVAGPEVAFEGLLRGGRLQPLALFDKPDPLDGPFFAETIYVTPSMLPAATQQAIEARVAEAAAAIGLREGPVHAELRLGTGDPVVIEVAARSIGGSVRPVATVRCRHLARGAGASRTRCDATSRRRGPPARPGVLMVPVARGGVLARGRRHRRRRRALPGVREVTITVRPGETVCRCPRATSTSASCSQRASIRSRWSRRCARRGGRSTCGSRRSSDIASHRGSRVERAKLAREGFTSTEPGLGSAAVPVGARRTRCARQRQRRRAARRVHDARGSARTRRRIGHLFVGGVLDDVRDVALQPIDARIGVRPHDRTAPRRIELAEGRRAYRGRAAASRGGRADAPTAAPDRRSRSGPRAAMKSTRSASCSSEVHGVNGKNVGRNTSPAARVSASTCSKSARVCPLSRRASTPSSSDSTALTRRTRSRARRARASTAAWRAGARP